MGSLNWAPGLITLATHDALTMTFSFVRSDKPVYTTVSITPFSPCHPTQAMAGPIISYIRNLYPTFPGGVKDFQGCLFPGLGRPHGGFPDCECLEPLRTQGPHQCAGAQGGNFGPPTLGLCITGPPCYGRYRQHQCCSLITNRVGTIPMACCGW